MIPVLRDVYYIEWFFVFVLGAVVGSFLNVVVLRYNTGRSLSGRSSCALCGRVLSWYELIPVFSFVILRGRCRTCHSPLSVQYPLVELLTATLFLTSFIFTNVLSEFLFFTVIFSLYVAIGVYDLKHFIVPDRFSYAAAILAFVALFVNFDTLSVHVPSIATLISGPVVATPIFLLWLISKGKWMGLGDAKLVLSIGWLLGIWLGFSALMIAVWAGALFGLGLIFFYKITHLLRGGLSRTKNLFRLFGTGKNVLRESAQAPTMKSEIPFAPFLLFGFFLVYFTHANLFALFLWYF